MKVAFFIGSLGGGGAERVTCELSNFLVKKGHKVRIIVNSEVDAGYDLESTVDIIPLLRKEERRNFVLNQIRRSSRLHSILKTDDVDCYVSMSTEGLFFLRYFSKHFKAPLILAERANPGSYPVKIKKKISKICKRVSGYVFQTEGAKQWYDAFLNDYQFAIIPNAVNDSIIQYNTEPVRREKKIVAVGRLIKSKNFELLINAFYKVHNMFPAYKLIIYGEGPERSALNDKVKQLNLDESVMLPGFKNPIAPEIRNAQIFALTSDCEGMPNALIEAMSLGIACVATDCPCGGPRTLIDNSVNGFLFPVGDEGMLVDLLTYLIKNDKIRENVAAQAKTIKEKLSAENIYLQWEQFIQTFVR